MNNPTQKALVAVLILLLLGNMGQFWYSTQAQEAARVDMAQLQQTVARLDSEVSELQARLQKADSTPVQGVVREANNALLQGWSALMNTVESELVKARQALEAEPQTTEPSTAQPAQAPSAAPAKSTTQP